MVMVLHFLFFSLHPKKGYTKQSHRFPSFSEKRRSAANWSIYVWCVDTKNRDTSADFALFSLKNGTLNKAIGILLLLKENSAAGYSVFLYIKAQGWDTGAVLIRGNRKNKKATGVRYPCGLTTKHQIQYQKFLPNRASLPISPIYTGFTGAVSAGYRAGTAWQNGIIHLE